MSIFGVPFGELHFLLKCFVFLLAMPLFLLCVGTFAFIGMGFGTASTHFGENPKFKNVLLGTMALGAVVTVGVALIWACFIAFSFLIFWLGG